MRSPTRVVIVGAGAAGTSAANELRRIGYPGSLTIISGESEAPYNRTTVNKGLLQGTMDLASVGLPVPTDHATRLIKASVTSVDTGSRTIELDDGWVIAYDVLLVANGARTRDLPVPVADEIAHRVVPLRTAADARGLRDLLTTAAPGSAQPVRVAVIGAGLIGAETADSLAEAGHQVTLLDNEALPLRGVMGERTADWIRRRNGERMETRLGVRVEAVTARDDGAVVVVGEHGRVPVEVVVYALGVQPDVAWLTDTRLDLTDGVLVDDHLRAVGVEAVYAAGDVATISGAGRFGHWGHALAQGIHAARAIAADLEVGDDPGSFTAARSFATRLHGRAITVLGRQTDREVVVQGDPASDDFVIAFADSDDRLSGAVVVGAMKTANKVRPFVHDATSVGELAAFLSGRAG